MDFNDTPAEADFRAEVRDFLASNAEPKKPGQAFSIRYGDDRLKPITAEWQRKKFDAGLAGITVPKAYGGRGGTRMEEIIYDQEEANFLVPNKIGSGLSLVIPTLMEWAKEDDKQKYIPAILKGEEFWCQLFSEPGAGSDLGGLRTRAEWDGKEWVVNGQKIWTSNAHHADRAILVTRSDPTVEKHKGLTYFFVDCDWPGIEFRRIKQISGFSNFNETFLTDFRIPDERRLGDVGEGWSVTLTTLMNERVGSAIRPGPDYQDIMALAQELELEDGPAINDPAVREKIAKWYIQSRGVLLTRYRMLTAMSRGETPGPENSISKLVSAFKRQEIALFGMDLMDEGGIERDGDTMPMRGMFQEAMLEAPSGRIAAGTDEIMRTILAERILRLPQETRIDKKVPYNQIQSGTA